MLDFREKGNNALLWLLIVYILWTAAGLLGGGFINLYFRQAGVTLTELVASVIFWAISPVLVIHLLEGRKLDMRAIMACGAIAVVLMYLATALMAPIAWLLYAMMFFFGTASFMFWVPLNIMFFEFSKGREAMFGSLYFAINPVLGIFLPLIGGALAAAIGYQPIFLLTALAYALVFPMVFLVLGKRTFTYRVGDSLDRLKGFKTLIFLEGTYGGGIIAAMGVIPLLYFTRPVDLGIYISVTTFFSVIASFIVSRLSDKSRKRKRYIEVFGSGLGVMTAICSFAGTAFLWSLAASVRNFFSGLFYPFTTAIIMDNRRESVEGAFVGREWLLNIGRLLGASLVLFFTIVLGSIHLSLAMLGLAMVFYPVVLELKRHHIRVD